MKGDFLRRSGRAVSGFIWGNGGQYPSETGVFVPFIQGEGQRYRRGIITYINDLLH